MYLQCSQQLNTQLSLFGLPGCLNPLTRKSRVGGANPAESFKSPSGGTFSPEGFGIGQREGTAGEIRLFSDPGPRRIKLTEPDPTPADKGTDKVPYILVLHIQSSGQQFRRQAKMRRSQAFEGKNLQLSFRIGQNMLQHLSCFR